MRSDLNLFMKKEGFTLVEILVVVGIITILATALIVAVNPAKRLQTAQDQQREIHLQTILSAIEQKKTLGGGWFGCDPLPSATNTPAEGQQVSEGELVPDWKTIGTATDTEGTYYNLFSCLVPKYLPQALFDPVGGSATDTQYQIWENPQTKYVSLRYVRDNPPKLITAGPETYLALSAPSGVETKPVPEASIGHNTAESGGTVSDDGGAYISQAGVIWAKASTFSGQDDAAVNMTLDSVDMKNVFLTEDAEGTTDKGQMSFDSNLTGLEGGATPYYVRAYAKNEMGVGYGGIESFTTLDNRPEVYTNTANAGYDMAVLNGTIQSLGSTPVKAFFCWNTKSGFNGETSCPNQVVSASNITTEPYPFSATLNLSSYKGTVPTTFYFQACGDNTSSHGGIRCGNILSFATALSSPHVDTLDVQPGDIGATRAQVGGNVVSDGGSAILNRGVCFSNSDAAPCYDPAVHPNQCVEAAAIPQGQADTGNFSVTINNLIPGNNYSICAYARNGKGLSNGTPKTFKVNPTVPQVTTNTATRGTSPGSAVSGGIVTSDGGDPVTQRGVCWAPGSIPPQKITTANCTNDGWGTGNFTSNIPVTTAGLWATQTYSVRAYAINALGPGWAANTVVLGTTNPVIPTLTTIGPTDANTYMDSVKNVGGNITDHGGAAIGNMGVCWNTSKTIPDINGPNCQPLTSYINLGAFYTNITGLYSNTAYYIWAYAQNGSKSIGYGDAKTFITNLSNPPTMATGTTIGNIGQNSADISGNLLSTGGDPGTIRGVCYSGTGNQNPTYEIQGGGNVICQTDGTTGATGTFTVTIKDSTTTPLPIINASGNPITYYALAFAHNSAGSAYGYPSASFQVGKQLGTSCGGNNECNSGHCADADGVCCDSPCSATCKACVASKTGGSDGKCANIKPNTDPDNECPGACQVCNSGACVNATAGQNPKGGCYTTGCGMGSCGSNGVCGYYTTGDQNCAACYTCGNTGTCVPAYNGAQDTNGATTCSGFYVCNSGNCVRGHYDLYLTSTTYNGNLEQGNYPTARAGADAKCQAESTNKPLNCIGTPWAFISISSSDCIKNFPVIQNLHWNWANRTAVSPDIANSFSDLLKGSIGYPADTNGMYGSGYFWSGSWEDGSVYGDTCNGWTTNSTLSPYYKGRIGTTWLTDYRWLNGGTSQWCGDSWAQVLLCACLAGT